MIAKAIDILLVEDSPTDALLLRSALEAVRWRPFAMVHVERLGDALRELRGRRFDVAVLDMGLPDSSGLEGLAQLRGAAEEMPILLLTGVNDQEMAIAAVERGAQDYLVKGTVDGQGLVRAIRYAIVRKRAELLQRAKEDAEAASRAKDHFLAILSHELRTPLTPVLTIASMLEADTALPERFRADIAMIRRNVELETRLIDDLLDVTRIARGKLALHREPIELCQVLRGAVEVCHADMAARQLKFAVDLGEGAPYIVDADAVRLQQVFWNLLKNAVKFTPRGGCVGVRCRPVDGHVVTEVSDSGVGITGENLQRIFNAFEQGDHAINKHFGGLGLGLAISRAIVEMHGGTIVAHSAGRNMGSTFEVSLPLAQQPLPTVEASAVATDREKPLSLLLVEDHGDTARAMTRLLRGQGYQVQCAEDMTTALAILGQQHFDLLISDMGLPDGSGLDLMREVKAKYPDLPGIALSGYGLEEDMRKSQLAGFSEHLVKPTGKRELLEAIAKVVGG